MSQSDVNPYASPSAIGEQNDRGHARKALRGPSLVLLILGLGWGGGVILLAIVATLVVIVMLARGINVEIGDVVDTRGALQLLAALPSCFVAYGAWCMRRGIRYRVSVVASILACIPLISPMVWIGIPFGIWAVIVLRRPEVRAAFATRQI
jgi:hypothetical protein